MLTTLPPPPQFLGCRVWRLWYGDVYWVQSYGCGAGEETEERMYGGGGSSGGIEIECG